ncbi:MAG: signal peptidase I [Thermomicrobiales bacterium]
MPDFPSPVDERPDDHPRGEHVLTGEIRPRRRSLFREIMELLLIVLIVFGGTRLFLLPYQVDGASMTPYLANGEHLFVNRTAYTHIDLNDIINVLPGEDRQGTNEFYPFSQPQRGDVIVLTPPVASKDPYVKRVIGLPGETVTFYDGLVFINGEALTESYIKGAITTCRHGQWCAVAVPMDSVYVLGDNRTNSSDSRVFGPVHESSIIGKAIFSNWPLNKLGPIEHPDYGN